MPVTTLVDTFGVQYMEAKAKDLMFLSQTQKVEIPFFQRSYVWEEDNWSDLLRDLSDVNRSHFLGSVIFKWVGDHTSALVIDGQQRLTTLSVLLKALYDTLEPEAKAAALDPIRQALCYKARPLDRDFKVRIQHSRLDKPAYEAVIRAGLLDAGAVTGIDPLVLYPQSLITKSYAWFTSQLRGWTEEARVNLLNHLLDQNNRMLVLITLDRSDDEQKIFDTINSAGIHLSSADIIKNALFQQAIAIIGEDDAIALYTDTWGSTFLGEQEVRAFWDQVRPVGRLRRDNLEILLHAVAVINGFYDPERHTLEDLGTCFKGQIEQLRTRDEVHEFTTRLCRYGRTYRSHFVQSDSKVPLTFGDRVRRLLHILDANQIATLHPYVLFILNDHASQAEHYLAELERFLIRRLVAGHETKSLNKLVADFVQRPERVTQKAAETTNADIGLGLRSISNKDARIVLFWLELARRAADPRFDEIGLPYNFTLEHVMPRKWESNWPLPAPVPSDDLAAARRLRQGFVSWIGNMTLLTAKLNTKLSNGGFEKKIRGEGRMGGMLAYGSLSITRDDIVRPFIEAGTAWDEQRIQQRTEQLEREFLAIWPAQ
jgi:hypothetical protein